MRAAEGWQTREQHLIYTWAINKPSNTCLFTRARWVKISSSERISQSKKRLLVSAVGWLFHLKLLFLVVYLWAWLASDESRPFLCISDQWKKTVLNHRYTEQFWVYWELLILMAEIQHFMQELLAAIKCGKGKGAHQRATLFFQVTESTYSYQYYCITTYRCVLLRSRSYWSKWQSKLKRTSNIHVTTCCHNISKKQEPPGSGVGGTRSPPILPWWNCIALQLRMPDSALI